MVAIGIDLHAIIEGCQQRPSPGTALKLNLDPFNAVSLSSTSASAGVASTSASAGGASTSASAGLTSTSASAGIASTSAFVIFLVSVTSTLIPPAATTSTSSIANEQAISSHEALIGGTVGGTAGILLVLIVVGLTPRSRRRRAEAAGSGIQEMGGEQRHEVDGQGGPYKTKSELQASLSTVELGSYTLVGSVRSELKASKLALL